MTTNMMNVYQSYYSSILRNGSAKHPRGFTVTELKDQSFSFSPGELFRGPRTNLLIGYIELLQFITGTFDVTPFQVLAPKAQLDLFTGQSAYGPRIVGQLDRVINELIADPHSRRAVMMIAHPTDTSETLPCTLSMQFQLENFYGDEPGSYLTELHTIVTMRSSDLVWGLPTDIIQFGGMAQVVARCLRVNSGTCTVNAGNAHIYEDTKLHDNERFISYGFFTLPDLPTLMDYQRWAACALDDMVARRRTPKEIFDVTRYDIYTEEVANGS